MTLKQHVLDRLLLSRSFIDRICSSSAPSDEHTVSEHVITAHDAAELALAAICDQLDCLPTDFYLMQYMGKLAATQHPGKDVPHRQLCSSLNDTRNSLKHKGNFPNVRQWANIAEEIRTAVCKWTEKYLDTNFMELDHSARIEDKRVKHFYDAAKGAFKAGAYKEGLEMLAVGLAVAFWSNPRLRQFEAGKATSDDAIRLAGYGVHAHDFLALQEFLPYVKGGDHDDAYKTVWRQSRYGHPANWHRGSAEFCLKTFLHVVIRTQNADWVFPVFSFREIYEQQIEALEDNVEIWAEEKKDLPGNPPIGFDSFKRGLRPERITLRTLRRGEKMRAIVSLAEAPRTKISDYFYGTPPKSKDTLSIVALDEGLVGNVELAKVRVTCIPLQEEWIKTVYGNRLPEIEWEPE